MEGLHALGGGSPPPPRPKIQNMPVMKRSSRKAKHDK